MDRIAVIGAGQLGSRHLQALALLPRPFRVHVVDPSTDALRVAKERFDLAVKQAGRSEPREAEYSTTLTELPREFDLGIIATTAKGRREILESLLERSQIRYLVLEKILFSSLEDYPAAAEKLKRCGTRAWVNCNMRMIPFYRDLKPLCGPGPIHYCVVGSKLRLASNLIHHIDWASYLTGCSEFDLDLSLMDSKLIPSRRAGYSDWEGTCIVRFKDGSVHTHTSFSEGTMPNLLSMASSQLRFVSRSAEGLSWISTAQDDWKWKEVPTVFPMQSVLTAELASSLLSRGDCELPDYDHAARLHVRVIRAFLDRLNAQGLLVERSQVPFT